MGGSFSSSHPYIYFEDMQKAIQNPYSYLIINTLPIHEQNCLILHTMSCAEEEPKINQALKEHRKDLYILLYGKHYDDTSVFEKFQQLTTLGFTNVFVYKGGMFEWLMLQDIYGFEHFPTTRKELDFLKYRPISVFSTRFPSLTNG